MFSPLGKKHKHYCGKCRVKHSGNNIISDKNCNSFHLKVLVDVLFCCGSSILTRLRRAVTSAKSIGDLLHSSKHGNDDIMVLKRLAYSISSL